MPLFQNESSSKTAHETEFDLHENRPVYVGRIHFHVNGFAQRLGKRQKAKGNSGMVYCMDLYSVFFLVPMFRLD